MYPYLHEDIVGGALDGGAVFSFMLFLLILVFQGYALIRPAMRFMGLANDAGDRALVQTQAPEGIAIMGQSADEGKQSVAIIVTPTRPVEDVQIQVSTPTAIEAFDVLATATPFPEPLQVGPAQAPEGYAKVRVVGRFSNYWPANGGINAQGDGEYFADGSRVDTALVEGWNVIACPPELLLGTRIEYPPQSGVVWTCRDRGQAITFYYGESGLPIYWFDFLSEVAWVDYGSYIQVDMFVPCTQTQCD